MDGWKSEKNGKKRKNDNIYFNNCKNKNIKTEINFGEEKV